MDTWANLDEEKQGIESEAPSLEGILGEALPGGSWLSMGRA